ncbi:MAG: hypothetical protein GF355_08725 [Candidatus Eisenbacteria bacterium]|nr:hypothetical protein [Candidatus Eisenbacteria bacterium]
MESKLVFDIPEIPEGESLREIDVPPGELDVSLDQVELEGPLHIALDLYRSGDTVRVKGEYAGDLKIICSRCLETAPARVTGRLEIYCEKREGELDEADRQALEDGGVVFHDGKTLDLRDEIRQTVLLELPWNPICREACRGLCPRCGADLNRASCACRPRPADPRWADLEKILKQG